YTAMRAQRGAPPIATEVRPGSAAAGIADVAAEWHADLVALATHGRGGLSRLLLGSVAADVLRLTALPLLLVRPQAAPTVRPRPAQVTQMVGAHPVPCTR
ncbi:MAG TPA: universal stress protein, partial [Chloroflexota bacterium]|nr:universal stress protein [Chloroflexota bacterium]